MPHTQLRMLVLPAPLGPMRASSSPARTSKDTRSRTLSPPKASEMSRNASSADVSAIPAPAPAVLLHIAVVAPPLAAARAQVELADVLVSAQPLGRAVEHDASVLHDVSVVREPERHLRVLFDEQQRGAQPIAYRAQGATELFHDERGEAER